jgi:replicative DNA helicase
MTAATAAVDADRRAQTSTSRSRDATLDRARLIPGGAFILDAPKGVPAVWGSGDQVAWSRGEPLLIVGPTGVGKTTIAGQLVAARLEIGGPVLGMPVAPGKRVLYLACDRPAQVQRALARLVSEDDRQVLDERLVVWKGPPPADFARHPDTLLWMCKQTEADMAVLDSLKDLALKLSDDETGAVLHSALQRTLVEGVEVLGLHHQRKNAASGGKPKGLEDVYGSTWITAGAGSVILLWGEAGDPVVELSHLKGGRGGGTPARYYASGHAESDHGGDHAP